MPRIFEERKQTARQVRLRKKRQSVRKASAWARWVVEPTDDTDAAGHTLRTCRHIKLKGAAFVEAHLMENRHFVRRKVVAFRGKIADLFRDKDRSAIRGRQIPSALWQMTPRHRPSRWEISRRPQGHALSLRGLSVYRRRTGSTCVKVIRFWSS